MKGRIEVVGYENGIPVYHKAISEGDLDKMIERGEIKHHHTATRRGYISRRTNQRPIVEYNGRFGKGYIVMMPRWDTTSYIDCCYYIFNE